MFLTVCRFRTDSCSNGFGIRLNGSGYPFKKNCHPFEQLGLSVGKNCHLFEQLGLTVRTAWAISLKKIVIRSNSSGYPFKKETVDHSTD